MAGPSARSTPRDEAWWPTPHVRTEEWVSTVAADMECLEGIPWVREVQVRPLLRESRMPVAGVGVRRLEIASPHGPLQIVVRFEEGDLDRETLIELALSNARSRSRERMAWLVANDAETRREAESRRVDEVNARLVELERRFVERDRMAAVSAMFASVAHDIRSPLTALVCNLRLLEEELAGQSSDPSIRSIFEDTTLACELIEGVLASMRTYASASGEPAEVRIRTLIEAVIRLFRWHMAQKGLRFDYAIEGDPTAWGTASEIVQVLLNLLANAAEASGRGGSVRLRAYAEGSETHVRIEDDGPGIEPDAAERVFEPFHTTKSGGLGIGLAVARTMARRHGGEVRVVAPVRPRGACLELVLPLRKPSPDAQGSDDGGR